MKSTVLLNLHPGLLVTLISTAGALAGCSAFAAQPAGAEGRPHTPPPEALQACKALSSGQDCSFTSPRGSVKGACWAPEGKPLACKPSDAPSQPAGQPKQ
jgi:hypothetical protein